MKTRKTRGKANYMTVPQLREELTNKNVKFANSCRRDVLVDLLTRHQTANARSTDQAVETPINHHTAASQQQQTASISHHTTGSSDTHRTAAPELSHTPEATVSAEIAALRQAVEELQNQQWRGSRVNRNCGPDMSSSVTHGMPRNASNFASPGLRESSTGLSSSAYNLQSAIGPACGTQTPQEEHPIHNGASYGILGSPHRQRSTSAECPADLTSHHERVQTPAINRDMLGRTNENMGESGTMSNPFASDYVPIPLHVPLPVNQLQFGADTIRNSGMGVSSDSLPHIDIISPTIRRDIIMGKDINLACLLIRGTKQTHCLLDILFRETR